MSNPSLQMYCGDGKSSSMATLWFQAPEASVRSLFHDEYGKCWLNLADSLILERIRLFRK